MAFCSPIFAGIWNFLEITDILEITNITKFQIKVSASFVFEDFRLIWFAKKGQLMVHLSPNNITILFQWLWLAYYLVFDNPFPFKSVIFTKCNIKWMGYITPNILESPWTFWDNRNFQKLGNFHGISRKFRISRSSKFQGKCDC